MFLFLCLSLMDSPWILAEISAVTIYIQIFTIRSRWCLLLPFFPSNGVLLLLHPSSLLGLIALSFFSRWVWVGNQAVDPVGQRGAPPHLRFIRATSRFSSSAYLVCRHARKDTPHRWEFYCFSTPLLAPRNDCWHGLGLCCCSTPYQGEFCSSCIDPYFLLINSKKDKKARFLFLNLQIW